MKSASNPARRLSLSGLRILAGRARPAYSRTALAFLSLLFTVRLHVQAQDTVRWIGPKDKPAVWAHVRAAFQNELEPDDPRKTSPVMAYSYKYVHRIAVAGDDALVLIGHRETEDSKYADYFSAFNFNLRTRTKTPIADATVLWVWKLVRLARFDPSKVPDIVFSYLTCTECEASQILGAFRYDSAKHQWALRKWQFAKDKWWTTQEGLVTWADVSVSENILSFDCIYGFIPGSAALDNLAIRCREVTETDKGRRHILDSTLIYSYRTDHFGFRMVASAEEQKQTHSELCLQSPRSKFCKP